MVGSGAAEGEVRDELDLKILHNGGFVKFSKNFYEVLLNNSSN